MSPKPPDPPKTAEELRAYNLRKYPAAPPAGPSPDSKPAEQPPAQGARVRARHNTVVAVTCASCGELPNCDAQAHTNQTGHTTTAVETSLTLYEPDT